MKKKRKPSMEIKIILSNNIRLFRKSKKLSQEQLAEICGLHRTFVSSVERGERNVTLSTLEALANALDVSILDLLNKKEKTIE